MDAEEYKFVIEWFDELAGLARGYILTYFSSKNGGAEISIFEKAKRRMFLKRGSFKGLNLEDLYVGANVQIYGRQFEVVSYVDQKTKNAFTKERGLVTCLIPASCYRDFGRILSAAKDSGFSLTKLKTFNEPMSQERISLCAEFVGKLHSDDLWDCVFRGSTNPNFRSVQVRNSDRETDDMFTSNNTTATFDNCSLVLIKPHAVKEGHTGAIISALINANFEVSAVQQFSLMRNEVENFAEVYKGVINPTDYSGMTQELCSGPCIAIEVRAENCVRELRQLTGPHDVEVAKALRPNTLRARFGQNKIQNAVHCTDLVEDGELECQYFFDIMLHTVSGKASSHK